MDYKTMVFSPITKDFNSRRGKSCAPNIGGLSHSKLILTLLLLFFIATYETFLFLPLSFLIENKCLVVWLILSKKAKETARP